MRTLPNEPVLVGGTIAGIIGAGLVMAVSLGWIELSEEQQQSILAFVVLVAPIVASLFARRHTTPVDSPQIVTQSGKTVELVRADTGLPPEIHP